MVIPYRVHHLGIEVTIPSDYLMGTLDLVIELVPNRPEPINIHSFHKTFHTSCYTRII